MFFLFPGAVVFVNPYTYDRTDLNQVWVEIPSGLVALGGDVHVRVHGIIGEGLRVRLAREDDEGRALLASMPLALDSESRMTIPCGYFSRGGIYYLEFIADKESYINEDYNTENYTDNDDDSNDYLKNEVITSFSKRNVDGINANENFIVNNKQSKAIEIGGKVIDDENKDSKSSFENNSFNGIRSSLNSMHNITHGKENKVNISSVKVKREIDSEGSMMETGNSLVKSWKFDVLWPTANLDVTPEHIQTYPERQVMAIIEFPRVVCTPIESSADFFLELLYCGHSSGGAVLCDGKNSSSHTYALYSEEVYFG